MTSVQPEHAPLRRVLLKHARDAFASQAAIGEQWRDLNFTAAPDLRRALDEYDRFVELVGAAGATVEFLPPAERTGLDSIYVRDATILCARGLILCSMGKPQRAGEPAAQAAWFTATGRPVAGEIRPPGRLEGGDVAWLDERTVAVGRGYRTNDEGIRQLRQILGDTVDQVIDVPLPHWKGERDVFHLMSILSPVDKDLAVVYSPLMPVPFRQHLLGRGYSLVDVPEAEFDSMGTNVLALAPRVCLMLSGNPVTRRRLELAGATVLEYDGTEISVKVGGGPTCLTRPLERS